MTAPTVRKVCAVCGLWVVPTENDLWVHVDLDRWAQNPHMAIPAAIANATPAQQDEAARQLWNGGRGCSNWAAC